MIYSRTAQVPGLPHASGDSERRPVAGQFPAGGDPPSSRRPTAAPLRPCPRWLTVESAGGAPSLLKAARPATAQAFAPLIQASLGGLTVELAGRLSASQQDSIVGEGN